MDNPLFDIAGLRFAFGKHTVINGLDLKIDPGHFYGIVGPNGCGKTTLLMLMMGYYRVHEGRIIFDSHEISSYSRRRLARKMALVPQDFMINFDFSVREIVMMGRYPYLPRFASPSREETQKGDAVMEEMGVAALGNRSVLALSGGEKQRVVFARALAQGTPLLLLDEATSNMDIHHTLHALDRVAQRVKVGKTAIGVFHDLNLAAMYCDRMVFMVEGHVLSHGETEKVLCEETIEATFGIRGKIINHPLSAGKQVIFQKESTL